MPPAWLLLHSGALGDLLLSIQLLLRLPGATDADELHVVSRTNPGDLSLCRPRIRRQSSEGLGLHWLFGEHDDAPPAQLVSLVRGARLLSTLGGPHTIVHHRLSALGPAALYSLDPKPRAGVARHIVDQWQTQLETQGLLVPKCVHQQPRQRGLGVFDELRERGRMLLRQAGATHNAILLHPGSGGRAKCWPLACFVELASYLRDRIGAEVCFLTGPVEIETWPRSVLESLFQEFHVLACPEPDELVALLAAARVFVGNDAGPSHLAALLATPSVVIFGPTSSLVWRPLGPKVTVLQGSATSSPHDWGLDIARVGFAIDAAQVDGARST
jgi:hypothetical protein